MTHEDPVGSNNWIISGCCWMRNYWSVSYYILSHKLKWCILQQLSSKLQHVSNFTRVTEKWKPKRYFTELSTKASCYWCSCKRKKCLLYFITHSKVFCSISAFLIWHQYFLKQQELVVEGNNQIKNRLFSSGLLFPLICHVQYQWKLRRWSCNTTVCLFSKSITWEAVSVVRHAVKNLLQSREPRFWNDRNAPRKKIRQRPIIAMLWHL